MSEAQLHRAAAFGGSFPIHRRALDVGPGGSNSRPPLTSRSPPAHPPPLPLPSSPLQYPHYTMKYTHRCRKYGESGDKASQEGEVYFICYFKQLAPYGRLKTNFLGYHYFPFPFSSKTTCIPLSTSNREDKGEKHRLSLPYLRYQL